jgi:hypothetical protein
MDAKTNFLEEWAGGETIRGGPKTGQVEFKTCSLVVMRGNVI